MKTNPLNRVKLVFLLWCGVGALSLMPGAAGAGPKYFKASYEALQKKACELAAHGSMAAMNSTEADIKTMVSTKTGVLDNFYAMASSYGHDDIAGASTVLKNEVRLNWNIKQFTRALAQEAIYTSEASIKFFLDKDRETNDPKRPALLAGYESLSPTLIVKAEAAFDAGQYAKMRKLFYHAIWIAYPVTSKAPYTDPK